METLDLIDSPLQSDVCVAKASISIIHRTDAIVVESLDGEHFVIPYHDDSGGRFRGSAKISPIRRWKRPPSIANRRQQPSFPLYLELRAMFLYDYRQYSLEMTVSIATLFSKLKMTR